MFVHVLVHFCDMRFSVDISMFCLGIMVSLAHAAYIYIIYMYNYISYFVNEG